MGQIILQISDNLIKKLPANQSDIEQIFKLGLAEYGVKPDTLKRGKRKNIKDYTVCSMWAGREDMQDSTRWVKNRQTQTESRYLLNNRFFNIAKGL